MLVCHDDGLLNVAVYHEFRLYHLRGDVFPVGSLKQVLDALGEEQLAVFHIPGIARMEPAFFVDGGLRGAFFLIVSGGYGLAAQEDFVVFAEFYFDAVDEPPHGAHRNALPGNVARHGGGGLREPVAYNHIDTCRMHESFHLGRYCRAGGREEVGTFQSERFAQEFHDGLVEGLALEGQAQRRGLAFRLVLLPISAAHFEGLANEFALYEGAVLHLVEHGLIDLFPEARHRRHARGVHLLQRLQHVGGAEVDGELHALRETEVRPRALKHVGEGQKVHEDVVLAQREHAVVHAEALVVHAVSKLHALAVARSAAGVEDIGEVVETGRIEPRRQFVVVGGVFAAFKKFVEIDGEVVLIVFLNLLVEDNDLFQGIGKADDAERCVVLLLLTHEEEAHFRIVEHIRDLRPAACGVERNGHHAYAVGAKVYVEAFGFVLREHRDVLLHAHAEFQQGARHLPDAHGKSVPRDGHPFVEVVISITKCCALAVFACLLGDKAREVTIVQHNVL